MSSFSPFPFIEMSGSPYQRGLEHDAGVPGRVSASVALDRDQLAWRNVGAERIELLARAMANCIERFDPAYLLEMRGIADGASPRRDASDLIDWQVIKAALADDFPRPDGVLRWPKPASHSSISATVATTLMEPGSGTMWIARKPYEGIEFCEYRL